jgi:hypothetical protein
VHPAPPPRIHLHCWNIEMLIGCLIFAQDYGTSIYMHMGSVILRDLVSPSGHPSSVGASLSPLSLLTPVGTTYLHH